MNIPEGELLRVAVLIVGGCLGGLVALVGWLLKRSIDQLDRKLDELMREIGSLRTDHGALRDRVTRLEVLAEAGRALPSP